MQRRSDVGDVGRVETSHRDTAVLGKVDVVLTRHACYLGGLQAREAEHTNLARDVTPRQSGPRLAELVAQRRAHCDDPVGHGLALSPPLRRQRAVGENDFDDARAVDGRVGVDGARDDLELREHALGLGSVVTYDGDRADALAVEAKVLCEGLSERKRHTLTNEVADGKGVGFGVARCESLVSAVDDELDAGLGLERRNHQLPLLDRRIDPRRVVRTRVEEDGGAIRCGLEVGKHAFKVEAEPCGVPVAVGFGLKPRIAEDGVVVAPRRAGDVDRCALADEARVELADEAKCTRARE